MQPVLTRLIVPVLLAVAGLPVALAMSDEQPSQFVVRVEILNLCGDPALKDPDRCIRVRLIDVVRQTKASYVSDFLNDARAESLPINLLTKPEGRDAFKVGAEWEFSIDLARTEKAPVYFVFREVSRSSEPVDRPQNEFSRRVNAAAVVVRGEVTKIRKVESDPGPITFKSPDWHDAVIRVEDDMKGNVKGDQIVVRFPMCQDVLYREWPAFRLGERGLWLAQSWSKAHAASLGPPPASARPDLLAVTKQSFVAAPTNPKDLEAQQKFNETLQRVRNALDAK